MSIIFENESGCLICTKSYFDRIYRTIFKGHSLEHAAFKESFFNIKTPFFMDSKANKCSQILHPNKINKIKKRKKKKIDPPKNILEFAEVVDFIRKNINDLITAGKIHGILQDSEITAAEWFENNIRAREAAKEVINYVNPTLNSELYFENTLFHSIIYKFGDDEYMIPAESKFHLCDVSAFIETTDKKFDLIVIDPPWINRSVKRKSSYHSIKYEHLKNLPFEKLVNPGCLIVVWVTNSSSATSFVLEELFPKCNIIHSATWHWCKITKKGDFIYPIESHHKKPYENLILGRVQYDEDNVKLFKEIDSKKLIVSIPSSIHSHKPPLIDILKPYVKVDSSCLELFARYLLPGWTSVGNEVLKLQNTKLFDVTSLNS